MSSFSTFRAASCLIATHLRFLVVGLAALLFMTVGASAAITVQFDYTYDTTGFFAEGTEARETLEWVGDFYGSLLDDGFTAIDSNAGNNYTIYFYRPDMDSDSSGETSISYYDVPADTIIVYVGANDISGNALAWGGPGVSYASSSNPTWRTNAITRGEGSVNDVRDPDETHDTAVEVAIWGGAISVNNTINWNEDHAALSEGNEMDLASVLLHEFGHVLGLGLLDSWENLIDEDDLFTGPISEAANGGDLIPVEDNWTHWKSGQTSSTIFGTDVSQRAIMEPLIAYGALQLTSTLDVAALDDIGWDINPLDVWTNVTGGTFSSASNWSTGVSPGERDSVRFDLAGSYTVSFTQDASLQRVSVEAGQVVWALDGYTVSTDLFWTTGSGTTFRVEGGTLQLDMRASVASGSSLVIGSAGRLDLRGATVDGNLTVDVGGELIGNGVITGDLHHLANGFVSPGGDGQVGLFTVEDDYLQAEDAILLVDLLSLTDYDALEIEGEAMLAGDLIVSVDPGLSFSELDEFIILTASDLSGQFDSILGDLFFGSLSLAVVYDEILGTVALVVEPSLPGDANHDGQVDGSDATILASHWQEGVGDGGATWEMGDFNEDGAVDGSDATILATYWQSGIDSAMTSVPEPTTVTLLLLLGLGGLPFYSFRFRSMT